MKRGAGAIIIPARGTSGHNRQHGGDSMGQRRAESGDLSRTTGSPDGPGDGNRNARQEDCLPYDRCVPLGRHRRRC